MSRWFSFNLSINGQSLGQYVRARAFAFCFSMCWRFVPDDIVVVVIPRFMGSKVIRDEPLTGRERELLAQQVQFGMRPEWSDHGT